MNKVEYRKILIVEDDEGLNKSLTEYFSACNHVVSVSTLAGAVREVGNESFDIVLLDVILPDGSGLKLFDCIRNTPVVILSDLGSDNNLLEGFSVGASDYVVKPCSAQVLEARMSLRLLPPEEVKIESGGLVLDAAARTARYNKKPLDLTSSEFNILWFLMQNPGTYYTAAEIYEKVWKMPYLNTTTIKVHLSNLRKKMLGASKKCSNLIITDFGKGYAFAGGKNE